MENTHLLVIDPQVDFCEPHPVGALSVPGADEDMQRLAAFIDRVGDKIGMIHVTLDCHQDFDIAHPLYWVDGDGNPPSIFTQIVADDVRNGVWRPKIPGLQVRTQKYVDDLEANQRYPLLIWPPHCLIGTPGNAVMPVLMDQLRAWSQKRVRTINYVSKGSNPFTEHYSAVQADVPDPRDPSTQINKRLCDVLQEADNVLVAGEASSHCVLNTVKDIADYFGDANIKKLIMITDAMSPVIHPDIDFPKIAQDFIDDMVQRGMRTTTTEEWMKA